MPAAVEAFCVKCKAKRTMVNAEETTIKNKTGKQTRKAMKGTCPQCGTKMMRFMSN